jgi:tripartite-type tricarboxylate transporter receptor subunit TctC
MTRIFTIILAVLLVTFFSANAHAAQPAASDEKAIANFYRGKTVTILVGHSAGGGFDTYARVISRHLGKYIPGNPMS